MPRGGDQRLEVGKVALQAGADSYAFSGHGNCTHAPVASIYNLRAEQWLVQASNGGRSVTLTLWHPASGGDMISLGLTQGAVP